MNRPGVPHEIVLRVDELLERYLDRIEQDIGDEAIDGGIDAARPGAMQIVALWDEMVQHL